MDIESTARFRILQCMDKAAIIFALTYAGVAVGGIPGLVIDRTGIALLGAIAMVVCGVLTEQQALQSIDLPTILLLFSLMVVSSQLALGGFYARVASALVHQLKQPRRFLILIMAVAAGLSAVLTNDVVCLALAPLLAATVLRAGLNPVPYLLGLAAASNIGSAATIIGNPQNILIGQVGHLDFGRFLLWCAIPSALSLAGAAGLLLAFYRREFAAPARHIVVPDEQPAQTYDAHQSRKGLIVVVVVMGLFFTSLPRELTALCAAGYLLCSRRMSTRSLFGEVDWHLLTLFCGLFIVIRGMELTHLPEQAVAWLGAHGCSLNDPATITGVSAGLSNLVSNVPATMLLTKFLDPAHPEAWYALALGSTFAGNLITIGSIANLIVIEQARMHGIRIGFREHARTGIPITLLSLGITLAWLALMR